MPAELKIESGIGTESSITESSHDNNKAHFMEHGSFPEAWPWNRSDVVFKECTTIPREEFNQEQPVVETSVTIQPGVSVHIIARPDVDTVGYEAKITFPDGKSSSTSFSTEEGLKEWIWAISSDAVNNDGETYEVYQEQRPFVNHFSIADRDDFGTKVKCRSMEDGHFEEVPLDQIAMQNDFILPIIRIRGVDFNGKKTGESIHIVLTEDNGSIEPIEFSSDTTIVSIKNVDKNSDGFQIVFDEESGMFTEVLGVPEYHIVEFDEPKMTDVTKEKDEKKEVGYEEELARTFPEGISKTIAETFPWMRDSKLEIIEASLMTEDEFSMKVVDNFGQTFMISAFFRDEESTEIRSVDIYEMPKDVQLGDMWDNVYDGEPEDVPAAGCFTSNEELRKFFSVPDLVDYEKGMTSREVKIIDFKKDGLVFVKYEEGGKEKVIKETLDGIEFSNSIIFPRIVIPVRGGNVSETEEINIPRGWDIVLVDYDNYEAGDMNAIEYEGKESSFPHSLFVYVRGGVVIDVKNTPKRFLWVAENREEQK